MSSSVGVFIHNLIARDYLSEKQQDIFLQLIGIKIPLETSDDKWPLQIYPRALAILAQVIIFTKFNYLIN